MLSASTKISKKLIDLAVNEGDHVMVSVDFRNKEVSGVYIFKKEEDFELNDELMAQIKSDQVINSVVSANSDLNSMISANSFLNSTESDDLDQFVI